MIHHSTGITDTIHHSKGITDTIYHRTGITDTIHHSTDYYCLQDATAQGTPFTVHQSTGITGCSTLQLRYQLWPDTHHHCIDITGFSTP